MRKIKNIFINLLGAALLAAGSAGTARALWPTADFGGRNVTSEVFAAPDGDNYASFLSGPAGDTYVIWSKDNPSFPGKKYDILAQRLANADGSKVWTSTLAVAVNVTEGTRRASFSYVVGDSSGGFVTSYAYDSSSSCYVIDYSSTGAPRWGATKLNLDPVVRCDPKISKAGGFAFVSFSTSSTGGLPEQSFVRVVDMVTGAAYYSGNGTPIFSGRNSSVPSFPGGAQPNPGAIFVVFDPVFSRLHASRVDSAGTLNWSNGYPTVTANIPGNRFPPAPI